MNTKELVQQGYDFFGKGDMEGFMGILHDDVTWVFSWGKPSIIWVSQRKRKSNDEYVQDPSIMGEFCCHT